LLELAYSGSHSCTLNIFKIKIFQFFKLETEAQVAAGVPDSQPEFIDCTVVNKDLVCMFGIAESRKRNSDSSGGEKFIRRLGVGEEEELICAGPLNQMNCNNSVRSVMMSNCDGRLGNIMMAYSTLFYFHKKMEYNAILTKKQEKFMGDYFKSDALSLKEGVVKDSVEDRVIFVNTTSKTFEDSNYPIIFKHHDDYKYNRLLHLGRFPTTFYLFQDIWSELEKELQFKDEIVESSIAAVDLSTESLREKYPNKEFVFIGTHVRRGDYVNNPYYVPEFYTTDQIAVEYITYCMDVYREKIDSETTKTIFLMLSEDTDWLRKNFGNVPDAAYPGDFAVLQDESLMPGRDMAVFKLCDHVIRTWGTYSTWGGLLSGGSVMSPFIRSKTLLDEKILTDLSNKNPNWILVDIVKLIEKYNMK